MEEHQSDGDRCCVPGVRECEKDADVHQVEPHKRRIAGSVSLSVSGAGPSDSLDMQI